MSITDFIILLIIRELLFVSREYRKKRYSTNSLNKLDYLSNYSDRDARAINYTEDLYKINEKNSVYRNKNTE